MDGTARSQIGNIAGWGRWFNFRLTGVSNASLVLHIENAGTSSFPEAWPGAPHLHFALAFSELELPCASVKHVFGMGAMRAGVL